MWRVLAKRALKSSFRCYLQLRPKRDELDSAQPWENDLDTEAAELNSLKSYHDSKWVSQEPVRFSVVLPLKRGCAKAKRSLAETICVRQLEAIPQSLHQNRL